MNEHIRLIPTINTDFNFCESFKSQLFGKQSNCVSIQQQDDKYMNYNALVLIENTCKSIFFKQLYMGWIQIAQTAKTLQKQSKLIKIIRLSRSKSKSTNKNNSIITPLKMKFQIENNRLKYRFKQKNQTQIQIQKTPATQRITRQKYNHFKLLSNQIFVNKTKREQNSSQSVKDIKRDIRIAKLEKIVSKIKKQHEKIKNGREFLKSNFKQKELTNTMSIQNQLKLLKEEVKKYQSQNFQLTSLLYQAHLKEPQKNASFQYQSEYCNPYSKSKTKIFYPVPFETNSRIGQKQSLNPFVSGRSSDLKNDNRTSYKYIYEDKKIDKSLAQNQMNYFNKSFTIEVSNSNNNNLANLSNSFQNKKRHRQINLKSDDKNNKSQRENSVKKMY